MKSPGWKCKVEIAEVASSRTQSWGRGYVLPRPRDYALEGGQNGVGVLLLCKNCILQGNVGKISKNPLKQNLLIFPTLLKNVGKISKIRPQNNCKIWKLCKNVVKISKICNYYMWLHNLLIFPTFLVTLNWWCWRNVGKISKISIRHTFGTILLTFPTFLRKICRENQ